MLEDVKITDFKNCGDAYIPSCGIQDSETKKREITRRLQKNVCS